MKKSSKKGRSKLFKLFFWACAIGAGLWLAFSPRPHHHHPESARVRVEQPSPTETAIGDEKAQPLPPTPPEQAVIAPPHPVTGKMQIAIIIDDVGLDMKGSKRAVQLPAPVTLSYMPYATRLKEQTRDARDHGHELMLHMPMEP
ncbi:MAG TPA: divergent polysaccharide deacetylase family protein, partial [Alphaproteobacteria bacterium]|nr:divergent polysaccharide deacetylase family protein [Alphaproteobacteria bacterium]